MNVMRSQSVTVLVRQKDLLVKNDARLAVLIAVCKIMRLWHQIHVMELCPVLCHQSASLLCDCHII